MVVLDSVGVGEQFDAALYGDMGAIRWATLPWQLADQTAQFGKIRSRQYYPHLGCSAHRAACCRLGKMAEQSAGKDTTTGHWEIAGLVLTGPFPTYPEGFPLRS